ncbi:MAG TPA: 16S rRNA (cytosine(967)-C(5))-methyltransferase RsmB [Oscillospiraceae bacterium]|nr:16S rRNA (cytosine(967)-C(5))-methyltransferase RsmB [Oscillospiraceae bacterium]
MNKTKPARHIAMDLLIRLERDESYSNILLDHAIKDIQDGKEKAFTAALFYGVLERKLSLDHIIASLSSIPLAKLSPQVHQILRIAIYQLMYMDYVPESAAVNEAVNLTEKANVKSAKGFVNAVLRNFIRSGKKLDLSGMDRLQALSIEYSCPLWLVQKLHKEYGHIEEILSTTMERPPLAIRVNTVKTTADELVKKLAPQGIMVEKSKELADCLIIDKAGDIERLSEYMDGLFHVQDISSQLCCTMLAPQPGETILDLCSAPGGKTFTLAQLMDNKGEIIACDLHRKRVDLVSSGAKRLGLDIIKTMVSNAKEHNPEMPMADKILCDVPCSGLGIIRRKPEIKYKPQAMHDALPEIQLTILKNSANYLKAGGTLIYSTCTLSRAENDDVVDKFLKDSPHFSEIERQTFLPERASGDGFFAAKLQKVN